MEECEHRRARILELVPGLQCGKKPLRAIVYQTQHARNVNSTGEGRHALTVWPDGPLKLQSK
eukprot:5317629-Alexandrium_andersonii.AAC.1